ncbi:MAG: hypothetical protein ABSC37_00775 [Xanthobacteraceae bacterium]
MVDPVDSRYDTVSRSLAKARNEAIFLNLVRASHDYPLSFTTIANVTPSMTNTSTFALPSFGLGPQACVGPQGATAITCAFGTTMPGRDVVFGNTTASNATAISTNFNVATQETGSFYDGFLRPIDLTTLDYFIRQDYSREMLFWLFAGSFQIGVGPTALGYQYSPPVSYGCPRQDPRHLCVSDWIVIAVLAGLTVEEQTIEKPSSGRGGAKKPGGDDTSKSGSDSSSNGGGGRTVVARFCFNPLLGLQAANQMGEAKAAELRRQYRLTPTTKVDPLCGSHWNAQEQAGAPQADTFNFAVAGQKFQIVPRSAYGVFEFLGNLMKVEREHLQPLPDAYLPRPEEADPLRLLTVPEDQVLFNVVPGSAGNCFSHTWFFDGDYCVPEEATNTKRIFSLLAQLIAIETAASDLSITPIVRVIQ